MPEVLDDFMKNNAKSHSETVSNTAKAVAIFAGACTGITGYINMQPETYNNAGLSNSAAYVKSLTDSEKISVQPISGNDDFIKDYKNMLSGMYDNLGEIDKVDERLKSSIDSVKNNGRKLSGDDPFKKEQDLKNKQNKYPAKDQPVIKYGVQDVNRSGWPVTKHTRIP